MIKLHVVQAEFGDCFILESKLRNGSITILLDGGPHQTFRKHLKPTLQKLPLNGKIDLVVLSHIDNDHIIGLLDLLVEIKTQRENGIKELVKIVSIWHNSFKDLLQLGAEPNKIFENIFPPQSLLKTKNVVESIIMKGFQQAGDLALLAKSLKIPINPGFDGLISVNDNIKSVHLKGIRLQILGPTKKNLDKLREEWNNWFSKKQQTQKSAYELVQILDKSIPNLASIMFLAHIKNRKILFTGDGLGQDIIQILSKSKMLDKNGKFYVDIIKVPHHGSDRNVSKEFFDTVLAEYYIISANGMYDNPSYSTIKWIIESERFYNKPIKILVTNETPVIRKIIDQYEGKKFKYEYLTLKGKNDLTIQLK